MALMSGDVSRQPTPSFMSCFGRSLQLRSEEEDSCMVEFGAGRLQARIGKAIDALYRVLGRNRITRFPWAVIQTFSDAHGALLSGSMAYYTFLSLLPLL